MKRPFNPSLIILASMVLSGLSLSSALAAEYKLTHPAIIPSATSSTLSGSYKLTNCIVADTYGGNTQSSSYLLEAGYFYISLEEPAELSLTVWPDFWDIGIVAINSTTTMADADKITVVNDGQANATYSLCLVDPQGWISSRTFIGPDIYILKAAFSEEPEEIIWNEPDHALSATPLKSTSEKFAGDQTGVNVSPGEGRILWLQFKAPATSSVTTEQDIEVIINAELP